MVEPAIKPMTLDEFLHWDDGTDTRYELIGGSPIVRPTADEAHRILAMKLSSHIDAALARRRPCNAQVDAGVIPPGRADTYFEADIAATSEGYAFGRQAMRAPFLIVEILSPDTERHVYRVKRPEYREIETVQEVVLIDSHAMYADLHRRSGRQWISEIICHPDEVLNLASVPLEVQLGEIYEGINLRRESR